MPELPEVETVCKGLEKKILTDTLLQVEMRRKNLRFALPVALTKIKNQRVTSITRRAKYILIQLSEGQTLIIHLGMSGRLLFNPDDTDQHDHVIFHFRDAGRVVFNDARRFGVIDLCTKPAEHKLLKHLGPEPLDSKFTGQILYQTLRKKKIAVKLAIMDQKVVVGVGNIYASESLWRAKISPLRPAEDVSLSEATALVKHIKDTLRDAIKAGGSSLKDYVQTNGELGYFQNQFSVYDMAGELCKSCQKSPITKIIQGGRSTFYCSQCQK